MGRTSLYEFLERLTRDRNIEIEFINLVEYKERDKVNSLIESCIERGIMEKIGNNIKLVDAVEFLTYLPLYGIDPSRLSMYIEWHEFEEFITRLLIEFGWDTYLNYRHDRVERFQIDIIALNHSINLSLFIECKHWKRMSSFYTNLEDIIDNHIKRIEKYLRNCEWVCLKLSKLRHVMNILPVIVTLHDLQIKVFKGVPIVSLYKFRDFILDIDRYIDFLNLKIYTNRCYSGR
ncbi:MAG: hypothetical protein QW101_01640 [Ignisphaera sp.]|uniref:Restriction endonuclease type IV Mrr domain-containing protein n=1 Tax=Ignisphaera aggregans TaxID=334771 RepID=A0A7J3MZC9_9CREN